MTDDDEKVSVSFQGKPITGAITGAAIHVVRRLTDEEIAELRNVFGEPLEPESWHDGKVLRALDELVALRAVAACALKLTTADGTSEEIALDDALERAGYRPR